MPLKRDRVVGACDHEMLAKDDALYRYLIDEQKKRGIVYKETVTTEIL